MEGRNNYFLCGGVLFFLVLEACLKDGTARDHINGKNSEHKESEIMRDFVSTITGCKGKESKKYTSLYKECISEGNSNIPFNENSCLSAYDNLVRNNYQEALDRVCIFVEQHFDENKRIWFVKAILDLIKREGISDSEELFVNENGKASTIGNLELRNEFCLQSFLLGVTHFTLIRRQGQNIIGKETLNIIGSKSDRSQRQYKGDLGGQDYRNLTVRILERKTSGDGVPSLSVSFNETLDDYLEKTKVYYSCKKTLLYSESPRPFYEMFVCNDVRYHRSRARGLSDSKEEFTIHDADIGKLEDESRYVVIEGTGGIGKTMFLTHLLLSSIENFSRSGAVPVLLSLKDYNENTPGMVDFIWKAVSSFSPKIKQEQILEMLESKRMILLMDGLDEISSEVKKSFDEDLEAFVKSYSGNTVVISSRPVYSFVAYQRFSLFELMPLSKKQAIELIKKIEFWDKPSKLSFLQDLDRNLFYTHREFASNPLLLTIMLMTYSSFGEIPAKMHVFYSKAFETMARLHDATKGSYKRPLHTGLTPEELARYFSRFCAQTYKSEKLDFSEQEFLNQMDKAIKNVGEKYGADKVTPWNLLLDLSDNLCVMYREGGKVYFIHRSFQEYFTAVYFSSCFDDSMGKVGRFFNTRLRRSFTDRTFDMLYDMAPEKVNRYIAIPFLRELMESCQGETEEETYWNFLDHLYPIIYFEKGDPGETHDNTTNSFLYNAILDFNHLSSRSSINFCDWPEQIYDMSSTKWVEAYSDFTDSEAFNNYPSRSDIPIVLLHDKSVVPDYYLDSSYSDYFGNPDVVGTTIEISISEIRQKDTTYDEVRNFVLSSDFPLHIEYLKIKEFIKTQELRINRQLELDELLGI